MPMARMVNIKGTMHTRIKNQNSLSDHVFLKREPKIVKTEESYSLSHTYENIGRYSTDICQLQNSVAEINSRPNKLVPLTHI